MGIDIKPFIASTVGILTLIVLRRRLNQEEPEPEPEYKWPFFRKG
jgi:hypothetical protein